MDARSIEVYQDARFHIYASFIPVASTAIDVAKFLAIFEKELETWNAPKACTCSQKHKAQNSILTLSLVRSFPNSAKVEGQTAIEEDLIRPISLSTRVALIGHYFAPELFSEALANPDNKDCLLRLYFGKENPLDQAIGEQPSETSS